MNRHHTPTADRTIATRAGTAPAVRRVEVSAAGELVRYSPAQLAARQHHDRVLYARRMAQRAQLAERDRHRRTVLISAGITVGVGLLAGLGLAGWWLYQALAAVNWAAVIGIGVAVLLGLAAVGRRGCHIVVQHWH